MRIDNSARGNADFVEELARMKRDGSVSSQEVADILKNRIEEITSSDKDSLKYLSEALQQQTQQQSQMTITESFLKSAGPNKLMELIKSL